MRNLTPLVAAVFAATLAPIAAEAAETGDIRGNVVDQDGNPLAGVEIVITATDAVRKRRATTNDEGLFRVSDLAPGDYELVPYYNGAAMLQVDLSIGVNRTTRVPITLDLSRDDAVFEVVDLAPAIDTTTSAVSTRITEAELQNLPVGRSFQDVVNTLPGVSGRVDTQSGGGGNGNPSVRGEGQYGNNFTIDGISTRDPATNTFGQDVNFDSIQEVQVYTDGAPAEFGQFTGMVVNVVTKDGGDEHHGSIAAFYSQHAWFNREYPILDIDTATEVPTVKRRYRSPELALTAGGPIIPEKLWYFTAWTLGYSWRVPEGGDPEFARRTTSGQGMGKLTWFVNDAITLRYNFTAAPDISANFDLDPLTQPEAQTNRRDLSMTHMLKATIAPSSDTQFELRAGLTQIQINVVPTSGDKTVASRTDASGALRDNARDFDYNTRTRLGGGLTFTQFFDVLGEHKLKAGAEAWFLSFNRDLVHTGETTIDWIDTDGNATGNQTLVGTEYSANPDAGYDCTMADGSDCGFRTHWLNAGPLGNRVATYTAFLQDDWTIANQLSLNLGARLDIEDGRNDEGNRPTTQNVADFSVPPEDRVLGELSPRIMPAPRLGASWDVLGKGTTKLFGNYGRYYDIAGGDFWEWGNARSANGFVRYSRDENGDWVWTNTQDPEGHPLIYAADLKPAHVDKVIAGVSQQIAGDIVISVRGILSSTRNIPEDVDVNLDDWYIMNSPLKERNYRALELAFERRRDDRWGFYGSYTLSESFGHTPGQFELASGAASGSNGNNVGVYLDDIGEQADRAFYYDAGYGWLLDGLKGLGRYSVTDPTYYDDAGFYGYLPYHSFHAIKLNGSYTLPFGTTLGLVYEFDSGHAWQKRTLVPFYGYDSMLQGRGTRFMPAVHYIDIRVAHTFELGETESLEATLDIFNLPGAQTPITYFENDAPGFGLTMFRQSPRGVRAGVKFRW